MSEEIKGDPVCWIRGSGLEMLKSGDGTATVFRSEGMSNHATPLCFCAPTIPAGYVLVPVEPTAEMIMGVRGHAGSNHADHYRAMIAAAPKGETA